MIGHHASFAVSWVNGVLPFMLTKSKKFCVGSCAMGSGLDKMVGRRVRGFGSISAGSIASIWKKFIPSSSSGTLIASAISDVLGVSDSFLVPPRNPGITRMTKGFKTNTQQHINPTLTSTADHMRENEA
jgi:hypothetical protein